MIINGEKFACQSCVKGHRVSNCNHHDRPLQPIAPKGRPVKQCDHCRDARKAKSHHTKCDCGSKRTKEKGKGEPKGEDSSCCCHKGQKCICGNKAEAMDLRLETTLNRPTLLVKSKPKLVSSNSENAVPSLTTGPQRPLHRHNHSAHMSGQPYQIPRPHTLHGASAFAQAGRKNSDVLGRAMDDMMIMDDFSGIEVSDGQEDEQTTHEAFSVPSTASDGFTFDWEKLLSPTTINATELGSDKTNGDCCGSNDRWLDSNWNSVADTPIDFSASPNFAPTSANLDLSIPSAPVDFFSPSDLPLTSNPANPAFSNYVQPISNSGESGFQSLPGLTTASSNPRSESGDPQMHIENERMGFWIGNTVADNGAGFAANMNPGYGNFNYQDAGQTKFRPISNHSDSYSIHTTASAQSDRASNSSTVVPSSSIVTETENHGVNIGHLENLATLRTSLQTESMNMDFSDKLMPMNTAVNFQVPNYTAAPDFDNDHFGVTTGGQGLEFDQEPETTSQAIMIPAGSDDMDDNFSWSYSTAQQPSLNTVASPMPDITTIASSSDSREYSWLQ